MGTTTTAGTSTAVPSLRTAASLAADDALAALGSSSAGQGTDVVIIGVILAGSIGLVFVNEYRAARAAQALHSQLGGYAGAAHGAVAQLVRAADS